MATSPQRQQPLKRVPSAEVTSPQRPVNQQLTKGVNKTSWSRNLIRTARRWSLFLFGFCLIDIF